MADVAETPPDGRLVLWDTRAVPRAVLVVLLAILSFQVSGISAACDDGPCDDESCPGDLSGGECAPNCHFCSCCSLPKVAASTTVAGVLPMPAVQKTSWLGPDDCLQSPEPADLLHGPRAVPRYTPEQT